MALLDVDRLTKDFGGLRAVAGLSFELRAGEILGLIGPNGAGKTTAFNLIAGFLPPTSGRVLLEGDNILGLKPHAVVKRGIARTFQIVKPFRKLAVLENVTLASFLHESSRPRAEEESRRVLEVVGLSAQADRAASDLTLGEQKRLEMARALATQPRILLLDEPMGGLNPTEIDEACQLVLKIREQGVSIVLVEHHMKAIMRISDRVIVLHHGEKIGDGPPAEIVKNRDVVKAYLGEGGAYA
jgi:branched-chain amino acid transport system ATP-binding protein